ncbi:helix-turn-helix protein [Tamaricihabitans halophyticus]|uniref:Helix-turn-helix protein n=1 Tax=Tamaricihabitans halophyticus TaxID=1262583 RepID=A0A4R2Q838_9PSEU|nr:helix-turn-helix transcriptional regulator [Tamaricihabitans halophyticus]TCP45113.1 helix-turn-helix protein [Tamaricihabitans halophyticus]
MSQSPGPTVRKKQLGQELRRLRREADISVEQVAEVLDCAPSRVRHIESGRNSPRKPDLTVLMDLYRAPAEVREVLEETRKAGAQRGWWATYRLPSWLASYVGMETDAREVRTVELELIPALLQTRAYVRRTHEVATHMASPEDVDRLVDARLRRQQRLSAPNPLTFSAIISESALARTLGEPDIAAEQIRHLLTSAESPNVAVRVLPHSAGLHTSMSGSFTVLSFDEGISVPVAYQEYAVGGHLVDDADAVSRLSDVWTLLWERAHAEDETRRLLHRVLDQAEGR